MFKEKKLILKIFLCRVLKIIFSFAIIYIASLFPKQNIPSFQQPYLQKYRLYLR